MPELDPNCLNTLKAFRKEIFKNNHLGEELNRYVSQSGKSIIIRESNLALGVYKKHYANYMYYVPKSSILLAGGTGVWKISSVACGFSFIKIIIRKV